ncbi:hypothetical protein [Streptococcus salivarius]
MNFIQFLIAFAGLVVGVSAVAMLFWYLSKTLKKNVIVRNGNTFTIVHLKELDQYPGLLKNNDFKKMGDWTVHDNGREFRGAANVSKEKLRQWIIDKYHLKAHQVIVTVPEEMKVASALPHF